ncbi:MAG TPA: YbhN family protein, partial [Acidimicrobiales bacterium]
MGPALGLVVVIGTFGFVLPQVADYASVWATIQTLSWEAVAVLVVVSAWNLASVGPILKTAFPGLRFWEAMAVAQTGTALSSALPGGEVVAYGMVYRMYRSFRLTVAEVAKGLVISGMFDNVVKFSMPVIAFVCIRITGDTSDGLAPVALIGVGLLVGSIVLAVASLRSESFARSMGDRVGQLTARPLRWLKRPPLEHFGARVVEFRHESIGLLRSRWHVLTVAAYVSELSVYLVLLVALRLVGVSESEVSWSLVLASFALVRILQSIPITPGGVGVVELGLTGALVAAGGDHAEVVAGVLVFRAFTWLPPLVTGPFFYLGWRRWVRRNDTGADEPAP